MEHDPCSSTQDDKRRDFARGDISLLDIARSIRRHVFLIAIITGIATLAVAVYYLTRTAQHRAVLVLDVEDYPILFSPAVDYTLYHHEKLGNSELMRKALRRAWQEQSPTNAAIPDVESIYWVGDLGRRTGRIMVAAELETTEDALAALELWAGVYRSVAPVFRARELLGEESRAQIDRERLTLEKRAVVEGLKSQVAGDEDRAQVDDLGQRAISQRIMQIEGDIAVLRYQDEFADKVIASLRGIGEADHFNADDWQGDASLDARACASRMVQSGLDRIFATPVPDDDPSEVPARIGAIFITSLVFACTMSVFLDWSRRASGKQEPERNA